ncbi:histone deacetylation protein Rxt3-domain-containing protein [Thamnocephalis sphaerospora]|uniref:Histone deacetylation protein Rxt3-domain-containing protein n=1 Tax=Thamnocephalis sphaerospora TaxID=78915 RepID=A0A4P9XWS6_9FUNG|nr:histone deacetylation protein Rxt3-domain-containing protein [Thamnocephalis sphaerospora]|eukprot:RKP09890.1 histone deacetylation protein Rxt3-domain-containing protein [Thamnocephalis sphaerospora]
MDEPTAAARAADTAPVPEAVEESAKSAGEVPTAETPAPVSESNTGPAAGAATANAVAEAAPTATAAESTPDAAAAAANGAFVVVKNNPNLGLDQPPSREHLGKWCGRSMMAGFEEYVPGRLLCAMIGHEHARLAVRVPSAWLTYTNPSVRQRRLWGTDVYTDDSDVVAVIIHAGHYTPPSPHPLLQQQQWHMDTEAAPTEVSRPSRGILDQFPPYDLVVTLRVVPRLNRYTGTVRNYVRSRDWPHHDGASFVVESVERLPLGKAHGRGMGRKQRSRRVRAFCEARCSIMKA